jgi:2',3'-cyclic-nucleotide 2'-phosphodiesterase (5'-nucleotidase family)
MQALPLRSMTKQKMKQGGLALCAQRWSSTLWSLLAVIVVAFACTSFTQAQQGTAIQPCTDTPQKNTIAHPRNAVETKPSVSQTLIDSSIPDDPSLEKLVSVYSAKVRALETVIGRLEADLKKEKLGGGSMGNFVTDGVRAEASRRLGYRVSLVIVNSGGLRRSTITAGELRAKDIFELLPFENALIELDLTGQQVLEIVNIVLTGRDAQSGAKITYRLNAQKNPELLSVRLIDGNGRAVEIDPRATYKVVTIDYLLRLASGDYSLFQEAKNVKPLGITIRDAMIDYVKSEAAAGRTIKPNIDGRFAEKIESSEAQHQ